MTTALNWRDNKWKLIYPQENKIELGRFSNGNEAKVFTQIKKIKPANKEISFQ